MMVRVLSCLLVGLLLSPTPSSAQVALTDPWLLRTPLSYQDCLELREQLGEEAKRAGDEAWEIVRSLPGILASTPETRALYLKASELHRRASELNCSARFPAASKLQTVYRSLSVLERGALKQYPSQISRYIRKRLDNVRQHNLRMEQTLGSVEKAIRDFQTNPAARVFENGGTTAGPDPEARIPPSGEHSSAAESGWSEGIKCIEYDGSAIGPYFCQDPSITFEGRYRCWSPPPVTYWCTSGEAWVVFSADADWEFRGERVLREVGPPPVPFHAFE